MAHTPESHSHVHGALRGCAGFQALQGPCCAEATEGLTWFSLRDKHHFQSWSFRQQTPNLDAGQRALPPNAGEWCPQLLLSLQALQACAAPHWNHIQASPGVLGGHPPALSCIRLSVLPQCWVRELLSLKTTPCFCFAALPQMSAFLLGFYRLRFILSLLRFFPSPLSCRFVFLKSQILYSTLIALQLAS